MSTADRHGLRPGPAEHELGRALHTGHPDLVTSALMGQPQRGNNGTTPQPHHKSTASLGTSHRNIGPEASRTEGGRPIACSGPLNDELHPSGLRMA